jgi:DNA repair protein RecO (recombination protein O)
VYFKTKAVVLKTCNSGKNSVYITAYTRDFGKVTYLSRGLNKNEARLKPALMPFVLSEIIAVTSKGRPVITRARLVKNLYSKTNFRNQILSFYFANLIDKLTEDRLKDKRIFSLIVGALNVLEKPDSKEFLRSLLFAYFPLKLIKYLGYMPEFNYCANCSGKLSSPLVYLSYIKNGALCDHCKNKDKKALEVTRQELSLLKKISQVNFKKSEQSQLSINQLRKIAGFVNFYAFYVSGESPRAYMATNHFRCLQ